MQIQPHPFPSHCNGHLSRTLPASLPRLRNCSVWFEGRRGGRGDHHSFRRGWRICNFDPSLLINIACWITDCFVIRNYSCFMFEYAKIETNNKYYMKVTPARVVQIRTLSLCWGSATLMMSVHCITFKYTSTIV